MSMKGARAVLVVFVACFALNAASAAAEPAVGQDGAAAVVGRRKMLAFRDLLQSKPVVSGPCAQHTQATKQQLATGSSIQTKQTKLATKGVAAVTAPSNRQLLQTPTPTPKPKGPVTPAQRRGFATGRTGAPNPKQQRRPPTASG